MQHEGGKYWLIPATAHQPLLQAFVLLPHAKDNTGAAAFADFLRFGESRRHPAKLWIRKTVAPFPGTHQSFSPMIDWQPLWLSFRLAFITTAILLLAAIPISVLAGVYLAPLEGH